MYVAQLKPLSIEAIILSARNNYTNLSASMNRTVPYHKIHLVYVPVKIACSCEFICCPTYRAVLHCRQGSR